MTAMQILILTIVVASVVHGARRINVREQMLRAKRDLDEVGRAADDPRAMLGLGRAEDLAEIRQVNTPTGNKVKLQETYEGLPVEGASVVLERDSSGHYSHRAMGHLVEGLDEDIPCPLPQLNKDEVLHLVARRNMDNPYEVDFNPDVDAKLEVMLDDSLGDEVTARLVYKINYRVENDKRVSRPYAIVDANMGNILKSWEGLSINRISDRVKSNKVINAVGGNAKIGKVNYGGKKHPPLQITQTENGTCTLRNNVARVYSCNNSWWCWEQTQKSFEFDCEEGFTDEINGAYAPLNDALYYIGATYRMFDEWYNIKNPLKREGSNESFCSARVHFGKEFENAFWDGYYITFGDGNNTFYPLTSINVVAHEIAHGVTEMNSDLIYWGESGGMNEAFSDMAGEAVEFYANKEMDWMVGYEIFKDPKKALRYFKNPGDDGKSIGQLKQYCPKLDPHYSSGLFNRVFYFLGSTSGWDVKRAFHPFVVANQLYWRSDSRFYEAACDVVQAAKDLKMKADDVAEAFRKVGIEPCVDTSTGLTAMSEIFAPAGHKVVFSLEITKDMDVDFLSVLAFGRSISVNVRTPTCDHCSKSILGHYYKTVEVCDATPGTYTIEMTPARDLVKGMIMVLGPFEAILENGTIFNSSETLDKQFEFSQKISQLGQVLMKMKVGYGYVIGLLRYGEPPSFEEFLYDHVLFDDYPALLCDLKPGPYFLSLKAWGSNARDIDVETIMILSAERMDERPINTRPPPTAPPSSEEDGSG